MENIEYLRKRCLLTTPDVKVSDDEADSIIEEIVIDIATRTHIFKKIYGFTVHPDVQMYNFRYIARLNEEVEQEPQGISFDDPLPEDVLEWLQDGTIPSPVVKKDLVDDPYQAKFLYLTDIYDNDGRSVLEKFHSKGTSYYYCYDTLFLEQEQDNPMAFTAIVVPPIEELAEEQLLEIVTTVVAGFKFYVNDMLHSGSDVQASNYDFLRYHQSIGELRDLHPTVGYSNVNYTRIKRWI
jgi:hypothetical protein